MPVTTTVKLDLDRDGMFEETISQYLISATVRQGRKNALDPMAPATAIIKLNNSDGRFSPDNAASPYYPDFDDNCRGIRIEAGTRRFTGFIERIEQDPFIETREVTLHCVDRLGALVEQKLSAGRFRHQPVHLVLNRLLDVLEKGEEIDNPGGEDLNADGSGDTTGYSAAASGTTISAPSTISFEGDHCIQAVCDGIVSGQGLRFNLGAAVSGPRMVKLVARTAPGDGNVTLTLRGLDASLVQRWSQDFPVTDSGWSRNGVFAQIPDNHRYIELITQSAVALTILSDCLHEVKSQNQIRRSIPDTLDAEVEHLALYDAPALEILTKLAATEAAGFLYMKLYESTYGVIYASAQVVRDTKTTPSATFGDDNVNVPYHGLSHTRDGRERVSEAHVLSEGNYEDAGMETRIWELSPTGQVIPAGESKVFRAHYSQPARNCSLQVQKAFERFETAAGSAGDGYLEKYGTTYPPTDGTTVNTSGVFGFIGQKYGGPGGPYHKYRTYLRFDTSGLADDADLTEAKLRIKVAHNFAQTPFTIEVRQAGSDWVNLDSTDWSADPGSDTLIGSIDSADLPPSGEWVEIDIDVSAISLTGFTHMYLISSRDKDGDTPTGHEYVSFLMNESGDPPQLLTSEGDLEPAAVVFRNYGIGADITLTAGSRDLVVEFLYVNGTPLQPTSEESLVIAEASSPPEIPRVLPLYYMPYQGMRTADMETEAERLAERHSGNVRRMPLVLRELDSDSLTQMTTRNLDDLIRVINTKFDHSTKIDDNFFIEGMAWEVKEQGQVLEVVFDLEEK